MSDDTIFKSATSLPVKITVTGTTTHHLAEAVYLDDKGIWHVTDAYPVFGTKDKKLFDLTRKIKRRKKRHMKPMFIKVLEKGDSDNFVRVNVASIDYYLVDDDNDTKICLNGGDELIVQETLGEIDDLIHKARMESF